MNRRFRSLIVAVMAVVVVVSLLGCQSQPATPTAPPAVTTKAATTAATTAATASSPSTAAPSAVPAAQATLKVGVVLPLSGPAAAGARITERFIKDAIGDVNAKGGIKVGGKAYLLEGIFADDKGSPEGGRQAADKLVLSDKVKFIIENGTSTGGAQAVTEPAKVIVFSIGGIDAFFGTKSPFTFGAGLAHSTQMRLPALYAQVAKVNPNAKRVAIMYDATVLGKPYADAAVEIAKSNGMTVVANELYPTDTKDFSPLVARVLQEKPDAIDTGAAGAQAPHILGLSKALQEQGFKGQLFGFSGANSALLQAGSAVEGYTFVGIADSNSPLLSQGEKDYIQRYIKAYGEAELNTAAMGSYTIPSVLAQALEKAGTVDDTEKVAQALRANQFDTWWGKKGFTGVKTYGIGAYQEMTVYLSKVEGGKLTTFASFPGSLP